MRYFLIIFQLGERERIRNIEVAFIKDYFFILRTKLFRNKSIILNYSTLLVFASNEYSKELENLIDDSLISFKSEFVKKYHDLAHYDRYDIISGWEVKEHIWEFKPMIIEIDSAWIKKYYEVFPQLIDYMKDKLELK